MKIRIKEIGKFLLLVLFIPVVLQSCKAWVKYIEPFDKDNDKELLNNIEKSSLNFNTIELKAKITADFIDRKHPLKVSIRVANDSIIWASLNLNSGLPIGKAAFTQDTIKIVDRVNNKLYVGDYISLRERNNIALNYDIFQSIIVNKLWKHEDLGDNIIDKRITEGAEHSSVLISALCRDSSILNFNYLINKETFKIEKAYIQGDSSIINVNYNNYQLVNNALFPHQITIETLTEKETMKMDIEIVKVNINKKQRYPFKKIKRFELEKL